MEDREITAWFLLDLSPSMDFGTTQSLKRDRLVDFVGVLARLLTRHGNRVGALLFDSQLERIVPPRGGRPQVLRIIQDVQRPAAAARARRMTDLNGAAAGPAAHAIRRRSLVFVISDFISAPGWERLLGFLARRHEVLAVQLHDPARSPPARHGRGGDGGRGDRPAALRGYRRSAGFATGSSRPARAPAGSAWTPPSGRPGVDVLPISTEGDLVASIVRFAELRRQRNGAASGASADRSACRSRVLGARRPGASRLGSDAP